MTENTTPSVAQTSVLFYLVNIAERQRDKRMLVQAELKKLSETKFDVAHQLGWSFGTIVEASMEADFLDVFESMLSKRLGVTDPFVEIHEPADVTPEVALAIHDAIRDTEHWLSSKFFSGEWEGHSSGYGHNEVAKVKQNWARQALRPDGPRWNNPLVDLNKRVREYLEPSE